MGFMPPPEHALTATPRPDGDEPLRRQRAIAHALGGHCGQERGGVGSPRARPNGMENRVEHVILRYLRVIFSN